MQETLILHGLIGEKSSSVYMEQMEREYVVADGETIKKGEPVVFDSKGKVKKVKASEQILNQLANTVVKSTGVSMSGDNTFSQFCFLPNDFETRFASIEHPTVGKAYLRVNAIRNGKVVTLYSLELENTGASTMPVYDVRMGYNKPLNKLVIVYANGNTATATGDYTANALALTHEKDTVKVTVTTIKTSGTTSGNFTNVNLTGLVFVGNGDTIIYGRMDSSSTYKPFMYIAAPFTIITQSGNGFLGSNGTANINMKYAYDTTVETNMTAGMNIISPTNARLVVHSSTASGNTLTALALVNNTHFKNFIGSAVTKRLKGVENRFLTVFTTDNYLNENKLGFMVYAYENSAIVVKTTKFSTSWYSYDLLGSWLLSDFKMMVLVYDKKTFRYKLLFIEVDEVTNEVTLKKEVTLNGNSVKITGFDFHNNTLAITSTAKQRSMLKMYRLEGYDLYDTAYHGLATHDANSGDKLNVILKGKIKGISGLEPDTNYYLQRDGNLGKSSSGLFVGETNSIGTLKINIPFFERELVTLV